MTKWKSFLTRSFSALIALALIIGLYLTMQNQGLKIAVILVVLVSSLEFLGILFLNKQSLFLKSLFYVLTLLVFGLSAISLSLGSLSFAIAQIIMIISVLLHSQKEGKLDSMQEWLTKSALGLFYVGLLPSFAYKILDQTDGHYWFVFLLAVVFAGDTVAYISGVLLGKHKVMPIVSPQKTWQGSVGGILGSVLAGYAVWFTLFPDQNLLVFLGLAAISGFTGQFGDFFESLLKRVADVKDSGKIMPGHGGVLDRIDGVLFASPVILLGILILSHL